MDLELINKISNLSLYGYYDPARDMIVVHFFNEKEDKADILAFLKRDMSWDVREIVSEKFQLLQDKEVIEITHKNIALFTKNSKFDQFVRNALTKMVADQAGDKPLREFNKMFRILEDNQYDS